MTTRRSSLFPAAAALGLLAAPALADQQIADDLLVNGGSLCVGLDCVNGESFGFDTIRMKENNLRIRAVDTSNSASFPSRDWQLTFNDSTNGGLNKFSIDDIDAGSSPFTIEGSAPNNALYVDDGGRVGLGTSQPVVELHIPDGDTPTLRLEQDGTSGFTPQVWDVAGNETNFFVRDVTNGSALPFRIFPGAPSSALNIEASGDVGIGTTSPSGELHIVDNGAVEVKLDNTSGGDVAVWKLSHNGSDFRVLNQDTPGTTEFEIDKDGNGGFLGYLGFNSMTPPTGTSGYGGVIYVDASDGDLKVRFSNGTVQTLATN